MYTTLYVIGNGFDLNHGMCTRYNNFKNWLIKHERFDTILELENLFGNNTSLWCDFETALGRYDFEKAVNWDLDSLYIVEKQVGNVSYIIGDPFYLDVSINEIVSNSFIEWVKDIKLPKEKKFHIANNAFFITFNYTETLEDIYGIEAKNILHLHGNRTENNQLIVGHRNYVDPVTAIRNDVSLRENNERIQRICNLNELYKPIEKIIDNNQHVWCKLNDVSQVIVIGHSCNEIDYLYFKKIADSIKNDSNWAFYCHSIEDKDRMQTLTKKLGIADVCYLPYPSET